MRNTTEPTAETSSPPDLIPLSHLVLEGLAETVLADLQDVLVDHIGRRCTTSETARRLLHEKAAEEERVQELWRRQREKATALTAEAQASIRRGVPAPEGLEHLPALALLGAGAEEERRDAAGELFEELASGDITYHPIQEEGK